MQGALRTSLRPSASTRHCSRSRFSHRRAESSNTRESIGSNSVVRHSRTQIKSATRGWPDFGRIPSDDPGLNSGHKLGLWIII